MNFTLISSRSWLKKTFLTHFQNNLDFKKTWVFHNVSFASSEESVNIILFNDGGVDSFFSNQRIPLGGHSVPVHPKFDWIARRFPDLFERSHSLFLSSHRALPFLLWHHPWIHAQDQPEELFAISVVHAYRLSEKPLRPQTNPLRWEVLQPWICLQHQHLSMRTCRLSYLSGVCHEEGKEDRLDELHLEIKNQMLILGCASGQGNKSARWLASSAKALQRPQILHLLEPASSQLAIPSKSL